MKFCEAYQALVDGSAKRLRYTAWHRDMYAYLAENGELMLQPNNAAPYKWCGGEMLKDGFEVVLSVDSPDKSFEQLVEELRSLIESPGLNSPCVVEAILPLAVEHVAACCRGSGIPVPPFFGGGTDTTPELLHLFEQLVEADAATRRLTGVTRGDAQQQMLEALGRFFDRQGYPKMIALVNVGATDSLENPFASDEEVRQLEEALARGRRVVENIDPTRQIVDAAEKVRREIARAQRRYRSSDPVWLATSGLGASRFRWYR